MYQKSDIRLYTFLFLSFVLHLFLLSASEFTEPVARKQKKQAVLIDLITVFREKTPVKTVTEVPATPHKTPGKPATALKPQQQPVLQTPAITQMPAMPTPATQPAENISTPSKQTASTTAEPLLAALAPVQKTIEEKPEETVTPEDFENVKRTVRRNLNYPAAAKRMGWTGLVKVQIILLPGGKLKNTFVSVSSGHRVLDDAVTDCIKDIGRFKTYNRSEATLILPVSFHIDGIF